MNPGAGAGLSRRRFLLGGAAAGTVAAASVAGYGVGAASSEGQVPTRTSDVGSGVVSPFGAHQAGLATPLQAHAAFVALDLRPGARRDDLRRWMQIVSDDIARLTVGDPALADGQPELATLPARLTVTVGLGPGVFDVPGLAGARPGWLRPLPPFRHDRLEDAWSGGDVLLQVCSDDAVTLSHAQRMLLKDSAAFARVRWVQRGFQRSSGSEPVGTTPRNLMGQVDGTVNPRTDAELDDVVWSSGPPGWLRGGTGLVLRRVRMDLDPWNALSRDQKEMVMGRRLSDGAPLTGAAEHDQPDLEATVAGGLPVIPPFAHIRLAAASHPGERMLRRGYNYDDGVQPDGSPDMGLVFVAAVADPTTQFVPVQRRLDESDALNEWTTAVGSAVFAVPPGFRRGGYVAETLLA